MDFRHQIASAGALSGVAADALLVVIQGEAVDPMLDPVIAGIVQDAVKHGDFQIKAGRTLYLHRPQGLKAARLVVAAAGADSVKAFKVAVAAGLGQLKGGGARSVAVALGGSGEVTGQHAEAVTGATADATYLYRQTKPSAPAATCSSCPTPATSRR
jgi:leucyl aminopeptidase